MRVGGMQGVCATGHRILRSPCLSAAGEKIMSAFDPLPVYCVRCKSLLHSVPHGEEFAALSECFGCHQRYGVHSAQWLTTDADMILLFDQAIAHLVQDTDEYSFAEACRLAETFYRQATDAVLCKELGVPLHTDESFHHEGPSQLALRIHYYLKLRGDPKKFSEWRRSLDRPKS